MDEHASAQPHAQLHVGSPALTQLSLGHKDHKAHSSQCYYLNVFSSDTSNQAFPEEHHRHLAASLDSFSKAFAESHRRVKIKPSKLATASHFCPAKRLHQCILRREYAHFHLEPFPGHALSSEPLLFYQPS